MKKTLTLTFTERFHLIQLMPTEDSRSNLLAKKDLLEKIDYSDEEAEKRELKKDGVKITWKEDDKPDKKEYKLNALEAEYVKEKLRLADNTKSLNEALLGVWEQIMN